MTLKLGVWLIDVTAFNSMEDIKFQMENVYINFNSDVFFYSYDTSHKDNIIFIWEAYKIGSTDFLKMLVHGNWSIHNGLMIPNEEKWQRRRELQVIKYLGIILICRYFERREF
jgi:hypothetical protein